MRVVIPNYRSPDSFVDNVAATLEDMGHEVVTPARAAVATPTSAAGAIVHDIVRRAYPHRWTKNERWLVDTVRAGAADLLLCLTQPIREEVLSEVERAGVAHRVAWWGDTPANMRGLGLLADGWTRIYIKDVAAVAKFRAVGLDAALLHEACNPRWHRRVGGSIDGTLAVAGNFYGYRQFLVGRLIARDVPVALYGPPPPRWAAATIRARHSGRYIVREEKSRVFGGALACLNSQALSEADSLNCRAFEIAGAGGLQLIEDKPAVAQCFEPGREILLYRSVDEIVDHLARARAEPQWAEQVRAAGHARAHAEHTYRHRLTTIIAGLSR